MIRTSSKAKTPRTGRSGAAIDDQLRSALAFATPSTRVVDFSELRQWLRTAPAGLGDRGRCELLLRAANGEPLTAVAWRQLAGGNIHEFRGGRVALPDQVVQALGVTLESIVDDYQGALRTLEPDFRAVAGAAVMRSIDGRIIAQSMKAAIAYGVWLFLSTPELGRALCRCRYRECRKFFFEIRIAGHRGRPQRLYCEPAHLRLEDDAAAPERMADVRRRKRGDT
jgi:hypothetical protein